MTNANTEIITNLADYYLWAEERVRKTVNELSDDEFTKQNEATKMSIRWLCEHIAIVYDWHFHSSDEAKYKELEEKAKTFSRVKLMNYWTKSLNEFIEALKTNNNDVFSFPISADKTITLDCIDYFLAFTDHATYHRAQIITHLKLLGKKGINTDFFSYIVDLKTES